MTHIFISYSKKDIAFARYLRTALQTVGLRVWIDEERIESGGRWWKIIEQNIDACAAFLVIMSPEAAESDWVEREILRAEAQKKPIYPVLLRGEAWSRLANIQYEDLRAGLAAKLSARFLERLRSRFPDVPRSIELRLQTGDITRFEADVVALKYAQAFHGADFQVAARMMGVTSKEVGRDGLPVPDAMRPAIGQTTLLETHGTIPAPQVLLVGTPRLRAIGYEGLRELGRLSLAALYDTAPLTRHLAMTMHGPGFGLDETEAVLSQLAGYLDALEAGQFPPALEKITIVEIKPPRLLRLETALRPILEASPHATPLDDGRGYRLHIQHDAAQDSAPLDDAGQRQRTHIYVALPPDPALEDIFYYGIQTPVHANGLLCERFELQDNREEDGIDRVEEALTRAMPRISEAAALIADVTQPDALITLQIGYAWGKGCPVILLAQRRQGAPATFAGLPCLMYDKIRDVEAALRSALETLKSGA